MGHELLDTYTHYYPYQLTVITQFGDSTICYGLFICLPSTALHYSLMLQRYEIYAIPHLPTSKMVVQVKC